MVNVARLFRRSLSLPLLSFLIYLILWNTLGLFKFEFLYFLRFLPQGGQMGFLLFMGINSVILLGGAAYFFVDFLRRWAKRRFPLLLRAGLIVPFARDVSRFGSLVGKPDDAVFVPGPSRSFFQPGPAPSAGASAASPSVRGRDGRGSGPIRDEHLGDPRLRGKLALPAGPFRFPGAGRKHPGNIHP